MNLNSSLNANKVSGTINLLNQLGTPYTAEKDGYLYISIKEPNKGYVYISDSDGSYVGAFGGYAKDIDLNMFIKKGMQMTVLEAYKPALAEFIPLQ